MTGDAAGTFLGGGGFGGRHREGRLECAFRSNNDPTLVAQELAPHRVEET